MQKVVIPKIFLKSFCWQVLSRLTLFTSAHANNLTYSEALKALRPLWFAAHPDFFCHNPEKQRTNEKSLQALNNYLQEVHVGHSPQIVNLHFHLRQSGEERASKTVHIQLRDSYLPALVNKLLKACDLPGQNTVSTSQSSWGPPRHNIKLHFHGSFDDGTVDNTRYQSIPHVKQFPLWKWLQRAVQEVVLMEDKWRTVALDIEKLRKRLLHALRLQDICWHSDYGLLMQWSTLQSLAQVLSDKRFTEAYRELQGVQNSQHRILFCDRSGISCFGDILLDVMRVPQDWLQTLLTLPTGEERRQLFSKTDFMESALAGSLGGLRVERQTDYHETISLREYHYWLEVSLNRIQNETQESALSALNEVAAVVDDRFSEPTISEKGVVVLPIHSPAFLTLAFLRNVQPAVQRVQIVYEEQCQKLTRLSAQCEATYNAKSIHFHPRLTMQQNAAFCEKLMNCGTEVNFNQCDVLVDTGYQVGPQSQLHVPWNWEAHTY